MLETLPAIRLPLPEEFPGNQLLIRELEKGENAHIVEGYVLHYNTTQDLPFTFYAEININNSRFWKLFTSLANLLPDEVSCIYNLYGQGPNYSPYLNKNEILNFLEKFTLELTQDCNLEFGLIFQTGDELEEIFAAETKYIKVWGSKEILFRQLMQAFNLEEIPGLNFIDEFPKAVMLNSQSLKSQFSS